MRLPTQAEVNTATRYATTIAGTAIAIFGLQAKGITLDQVKDLIAALGDTANNVVIVIGMIAPFWYAARGVASSSPTAQAAAIGANARTIVNATPDGKATVTILDPVMAAAAVEAQKNAA